MSTRSNIIMENSDGTFECIYCHSDGYPGYNGRILYENYKTEREVRKLIALGDLSSLGETLGKKHAFDWYTKAYSAGQTHEQIQSLPYARMCTAFGRDRGEQDVSAKRFESAEQLAEFVEQGWTEWVYIFRVSEGKWFYTNNPTPTWFKCCGTTQRTLDELTPDAWAEKAVEA